MFGTMEICPRHEQLEPLRIYVNIRQQEFNGTNANELQPLTEESG